MQKLVWTLGMTALLSCRTRDDAQAERRQNVLATISTATVEADTPSNVVVRTYGALHRVMHEQQTGPAVELAGLLSPRLYALGALSELRGEVTVLEGAVWTAYPEGNDTRVEVSSTSAEQATLLVAAAVSEWHHVPLSHDVNFRDLDATVESFAKAAGLDVERPLPFLVEGEFEALEWHVIDGTKLPYAPAGHLGHLQAAVKRRATDVVARTVGFFSKRHRGVFTHHDSNTHVHAVIPTLHATGHVDAAIVKAGATLRLPR